MESRPGHALGVAALALLLSTALYRQTVANAAHNAPAGKRRKVFNMRLEVHPSPLDNFSSNVSAGRNNDACVLAPASAGSIRFALQSTGNVS